MHDVKSWELCFIWRITENYSSGLPGWLRWWKVCLQCRGPKFKPWVGKTPWRRKWHPTPVLLPGKSHGWRSLVACSPWGREESDTAEWLPFHFSLSCIGEGNGNPLHCSCLENPRDGGAWQAAFYGVTQSRIWLKWLSSSSSSIAQGFPSGSDGEESACGAGDPSSIPGSGRPPGEGNGNPLQYSCLAEEPGGLQSTGLQRADMTERLHFHYRPWIQTDHREPSKEIREESGHMSFDRREAKKPKTCNPTNITRWLLITKTRHLKLMILVLFCVCENARVWVYWSHSFDPHLICQYSLFSILNSL